MPPQTNAQLRTVNSQGSTDTFSEPGTADLPKFEGGLSVYYDTRRQRTVGPDGANVVVWRSLILDDVVPVDVAVGDRVEWSYRGELLSGTVQAIEPSDNPAISAMFRTTRLTLDPE